MKGTASTHSRSGWLLAAPALGLLVLAFLWPMLTLARMSLNQTSDTGAMIEAWSLSTYAKLTADRFTWRLTLDSLALSAFAATAAVILAYSNAPDHHGGGAAAGVRDGAGDRLARHPRRSRADQRLAHFGWPADDAPYQ
jgi:hypothetical protein